MSGQKCIRLDHARVGHGDNSLDPNPWLERKPGATEKYLFQYLRKVRAETPNPDNVLYIEDSEKWKYQIVFSQTGLAYERPSEIGGQVLQFRQAHHHEGFRESVHLALCRR